MAVLLNQPEAVAVIVLHSGNKFFPRLELLSVEQLAFILEHFWWE